MISSDSDAQAAQAALSEVADQRATVEAAEALAVKQARQAGMDWASIATVLGLSRSHVRKYYGHA
jgi:DNA-binding transcriptional regulator YiaG